MDLPEETLLLHAEWIELQAKATAAVAAEYAGWRIEDPAERFAAFDAARARSCEARDAARDAGRVLAQALPEQSAYAHKGERCQYVAAVASAQSARRNKACAQNWPTRYRAVKLWNDGHACWYIGLEEVRVDPADGSEVVLGVQMFDNAVCEADRRNRQLADLGWLARAA